MLIDMLNMFNGPTVLKNCIESQRLGARCLRMCKLAPFLQTGYAATLPQMESEVH